MKAEYEAAAGPVCQIGHQAVLRRPMRLVMPYASLDSQTGLPTFTVSLPLDQWGSLAGFRSVLCSCIFLSVLLLAAMHDCFCLAPQSLLAFVVPSYMQCIATLKHTEQVLLQWAT